MDFNAILSRHRREAEQRIAENNAIARPVPRQSVFGMARNGDTIKAESSQIDSGVSGKQTLSSAFQQYSTLPSPFMLARPNPNTTATNDCNNKANIPGKRAVALQDTSRAPSQSHSLVAEHRLNQALPSNTTLKYPTCSSNLSVSAISSIRYMPIKRRLTHKRFKMSISSDDSYSSVETAAEVWDKTPITGDDKLHAETTQDQSRLKLEDADDDMEELLRYVMPPNDDGEARHDGTQSQARIRDYENTPIFTKEVERFLRSSGPQAKGTYQPFPQYGFLGTLDATDYAESTTAGRLGFVNMNSPWSAFICGSQGAGKSHTLSVLLENALLEQSSISRVPNPLAGLVLHYDKFTSIYATQVCEAAYLCSSGIPVKVLVSPSNIWAMKEMYHNLPGLPENAPRPEVVPLYLSPKLLNTGTILKLMGVNTGSSAGSTDVPLYLHVVHSILMQMAMEGNAASGFSYPEFRRRLDGTNWVKGQDGPLQMRLALLESLLEPSALSKTSRPAAATQDIWAFDKGTLTIVDLSDPFIGENDACVLFNICLSLFIEGRSKSGRIVALDEAHKFLTKSGEAKALTEDLTSIIRQQRHTGTRVLIATQEPTLSPTLIDLCNVTVVHRFLSPAWYRTLHEHLAGANKRDTSGGDTLFEVIVRLQTGEALLFCPTALLGIENSDTSHAVRTLGSGYARIRVRNRQTVDGGVSVMASDGVRTRSESRSAEVPMYMVAQDAIAPRQTRSMTKPYQGNLPAAAASTYQTAQLSAPVQNSGFGVPVPVEEAIRQVMRIEWSRGWRKKTHIIWSDLWSHVKSHANFEDSWIAGRSSQCRVIAVNELANLRAAQGMSMG